jgi:hypothetical protein
MKTPTAGDGTLLKDEAHLYGRVAFPINITVTGSIPYETPYSRLGEPCPSTSRNAGENS